MKEKNNWLSTFLIRFILIFQLLIIVIPLIWVLLNSLKGIEEFYFNPWLPPKVLKFDNYYKALIKANIFKNFLNTIYVIVPTMFLTIVLGATTAYILTKHAFRGSDFIFKLFMMALFLPAIVALIPIFLLVKRIGLYNNLLSLVLIYTASNLPFTIFVLSGYYKSLPYSYVEAAYLDGCSLFKTFWLIIFPISKAPIFTVSLICFINNWNEFTFAFLLIPDNNKRTISAGLVNLFEVQRYATDWGALYAGLIITIIPVGVIYFMFQKILQKGLTGSGLKE